MQVRRFPAALVPVFVIFTIGASTYSLALTRHYRDRVAELSASLSETHAQLMVAQHKAEKLSSDLERLLPLPPGEVKILAPRTGAVLRQLEDRNATIELRARASNLEAPLRYSWVVTTRDVNNAPHRLVLDQTDARVSLPTNKLPTDSRLCAIKPQPAAITVTVVDRHGRSARATITVAVSCPEG